MANEEVPMFVDDFGRTAEQAMDPNDPMNKVARGLATGAGDAVKGTVHAVTHPVETLKGIASWFPVAEPEMLAASPELAALEQARVTEKVDQLSSAYHQIGATIASGDPFEISRMVGNVVTQGVLLKGAGAAVGAAGRVAGFGKAGAALGRAGELGRATTEGGAAADVARAAAGDAPKPTPPRLCPNCKKVHGEELPHDAPGTSAEPPGAARSPESPLARPEPTPPDAAPPADAAPPDAAPPADPPPADPPPADAAPPADPPPAQSPYEGTPMEQGRRGEPTLGTSSLSPEEIAMRDQRYSDLRSAAATIETDPAGMPARLQALREKWGADFTINEADPMRLGETSLARAKAEANTLAKSADFADTPPEEIHRALADERFSDMQRGASSNRAQFDPTTGEAQFPRAVEFYKNDATRAPDLTDPFERQLATNLARAQLEEATHAAGFTVRSGAYVPLSPEMEGFGTWMKTPEGTSWLRENMPNASDLNRPHEADITALLQDVSAHGPTELGVYDIRQALQEYLKRTGK